MGGMQTGGGGGGQFPGGLVQLPGGGAGPPPPQGGGGKPGVVSAGGGGIGGGGKPGGMQPGSSPFPPGYENIMGQPMVGGPVNSPASGYMGAQANPLPSSSGQDSWSPNSADTLAQQRINSQGGSNTIRNSKPQTRPAQKTTQQAATLNPPTTATS